MTKEDFTELLARFEQGRCTAEEQARLATWVDAMPEGRAPFGSALEKTATRTSLLVAIYTATGLAEPATPAVAGQPQPWRLRVRARNWRVSAAALLLLLGAVGTYYYHGHPSVTTPAVAQAGAGIAPGGNKATLTLADGTAIRLMEAPNGALARQGRVAINKAGEGEVVYDASHAGPANAATLEYNTITIPRGGQYRLQLADGTKVWLNAASSLTYPTAFAGSERRVVLTGEAYFEVAHNKKRPFRVQTATQQVEVVGTHFNVNAYADEPAVKTTLLEGAVRVARRGAVDVQVLRPGQQAVLAANGLIAVSETDTEAAVAWKNGLFQFRKADLKTVMRQMARWYDVDVAYEGAVPDKQFSGELYRSANASQVLDMLRYSNVHISIEAAPVGSRAGKRIVIRP